VIVSGNVILSGLCDRIWRWGERYRCISRTASSG